MGGIGLAAGQGAEQREVGDDPPGAQGGQGHVQVLEGFQADEEVRRHRSAREDPGGSIQGGVDPFLGHETGPQGRGGGGGLGIPGQQVVTDRVGAQVVQVQDRRRMCRGQDRDGNQGRQSAA